MKHAQVINGTYPGPLIEACWGDTIEVKVKNVNRDNGTTIHWHGLRMLGENQMDGVNGRSISRPSTVLSLTFQGITQCPIAPGDVFTYKFRVRQYGPTWYHSHYSSQYSDGVAAPLLIHGPSNDNWDEEWAPIIVSDWYHENCYASFRASLTAPRAPPADSIVVNGTGRFNGGGNYFQQTFEAGKKYLIHIVNGGTDFHFQFSIDNHMLEVVAADMVPIKPFLTESISVGIGQRYSLIVHADQTAASNGKYWMRTEYTDGACQFNQDAFPVTDRDTQRVGIISYVTASNDSTHANATARPTNGNTTSISTPTTSRWPVTVGCSDPIFEPSLPWKVTAPQNDILRNAHYAGLGLTSKVHGAYRWEIGETPMWLNFSDPSLLHASDPSWTPPREYALEPCKRVPIETSRSILRKC
jgi:FtsP/CotA-like multicopper oxidase with cupredoxin domain